MPIEQARALASSKGYTFSGPVVAPGSNGWVSYVLMSNGPSLSFCRNALAAITKQYPSSPHEFVSLLKSWTDSLGQPEVGTNQQYFNGNQVSDISFRWTSGDDVQRSLSLNHYASAARISYGFFLIRHPCKAD